MGTKKVPTRTRILDIVGTFCPHNVGFTRAHPHTHTQRVTSGLVAVDTGPLAEWSPINEQLLRSQDFKNSCLDLRTAAV